MCEVVVAASCLLSSDKNELNTVCHGHGSVDEFIYVCGNELNFSNIIPSIDIYLFPQ